MKKLLLLTLITATAAQSMENKQSWTSWLFGCPSQQKGYWNCAELKKKFADLEALTPEQLAQVVSKEGILTHTSPSSLSSIYYKHLPKLAYLTLCKNYKLHAPLKIQSQGSDEFNYIRAVAHFIRQTNSKYTCEGHHDKSRNHCNLLRKLTELDISSEQVDILVQQAAILSNYNIDDEL